MTVRKVGEDLSVPKRVTCKTCGAILEYLPIDIQHTRPDYDGDTNAYIRCCECKATVYVTR